MGQGADVRVPADEHDDGHDDDGERETQSRSLPVGASGRVSLQSGYTTFILTSSGSVSCAVSHNADAGRSSAGCTIMGGAGVPQNEPTECKRS